jgi:hypothetical protein
VGSSFRFVTKRHRSRIDRGEEERRGRCEAHKPVGPKGRSWSRRSPSRLSEKGCARAATFGEGRRSSVVESPVQWRRWRSEASRRWHRRPLDRLGFGVGWRLGSEPRGLSLLPPLPLIWHCATGAHQPRWIGCPRSGRGQRIRIGRWANSVETYSNILPFDLNLSFNFKL